MHIIIRSAFLCCFLCATAPSLQAQSVDTIGQKAFIVARLIEKFHLQPNPLNAEMGQRICQLFLQKMDDDRLYFTAEDLKQFYAEAAMLPAQIGQKKSAFLQRATALYKTRQQQADSILQVFASKPVALQSVEFYGAGYDSSIPANLNALAQKREKQWKRMVLQGMADAYPATMEKASAARQKIWLDSAEKTVRAQVILRQQKMWQRQWQRPGGLAQWAAGTYLAAIAEAYDPHTNYFDARQTQAFNEALGQNRYAFGFRLDADPQDDDKVVIGELKPGSPAYNSGQLSKGDAIEAVQWGHQQPIQVGDAGAEELSEVLSLGVQEQATLSIRKPDGSRRQVVLSKAKTTDVDESIKVQGYLMQGSRKMGYINLPSFYEDWVNKEGTNGCANDVAREVMKLKKEGMEALILDLRFNGGGSLQEAIDLAGIFIDAGPMLQLKSREEKLMTGKDVNRGTVYDGPLILLVNGYSASASELVAAALQDYQRALVVGTPTYGKATGQGMYPLDTVLAAQVSSGTYKQAEVGEFLKITGIQLFRINGGTAQFTGVQPQILVPDLTSRQANKERDEPFAIRPVQVEPNKYYKPLPPLPIARLQAEAAALLAQDTALKHMQAQHTVVPNEESEWPLQWNAYLKRHREEKERKTRAAASILQRVSSQEEPNAAFRLVSTAGENDETNLPMRMWLSKDPQLHVAYKMALSLLGKPTP